MQSLQQVLAEISNLEFSSCRRQRFPSYRKSLVTFPSRRVIPVLRAALFLSPASFSLFLRFTETPRSFDPRLRRLRCLLRFLSRYTEFIFVKHVGEILFWSTTTL